MEKAEEKRPHGRYDDKGNRVVKKDGVIYSVDKGGNYTKYTGPLYDENHNKLEMKKSDIKQRLDSLKTGTQD